MGVDVTTEITIARPRDVVSAFSAHPSNVPTWYKNIRSVEWLTDPVPEVGSKIAFVAHFLGRRLAYTYEIKELLPGERLLMATDEGPFPMETTYTWADAPGAATRMTLRNRGEPRGFSALAAIAMVPAMRRANRKDLSLLKSVLESR